MSSLKELSSVHSLPTLVQLCSLEGTKLVLVVYVNISSLFSMGLVRAGYKTKPFPFCCAHCPTAQNSGPCQPGVGNAERPFEGSGMHHTQIIIKCFLCHRGWRSNVQLIVEDKNLYVCL